MQVEIDSHIVRTFWALYQRISKSIHVLAIIEMHLKIFAFPIFCLGCNTYRVLPYLYRNFLYELYLDL